MSDAALSLLESDDDSQPQDNAAKRAISILESGKVPREKPAPPAPRKTSGMPGLRTVGARAPDVDIRRGEAPLALGTGAAASTVGGIHGVGSLLLGHSPEEAAKGVQWWQQALTYQPRTEQGEQATQGIVAAMESPFNPLTWPGRLGEFGADQATAAGMGPGVATVLRMAPEVATAFIGAPGEASAAARTSLAGDVNAVRSAVPKMGETLEKLADVREAPRAAGAEADPLLGFGADSASAAAASRINAAKGVSPELLQDLRSQVQRGPLDAAAVDRQLDADSLPIRMQLTEGQASRDVEVASREYNSKGKDPEIAQRYNQQNQQLIDNLDELRRQAAPQAVAHDPVQSGQNIVDAYKTADNAATEEINAAYQAARDANGGDLPMDAPAFMQAADAALKKNMKSRYVPAEIAADLNEIRETGVMNFETFENLRTNLAAEGRKAERSSDGNATAAINLVRDALENIQPIGRAAEVKPLFDRARSLAKARFDKIKADPAYKASVNDDVGVGESSPLADKFVQKYIVGGNRAHVERMLDTLGGDELAVETIRAAPFNYLKQKAGIDPYRNEGNFSQHGYNRALAELTPKMDLLAGEELAEQAQRLGRVSHDVKELPSGNYANRSHTFVAAAADAAKGLAERSANTILGGNIVPVGSWAREKLDARTVAREQKERMRPAAGTLAKEKKP